MANERLRALEDVEKEIAMILQCAGKDITHLMCVTLELCILNMRDLFAFKPVQKQDGRIRLFSWVSVFHLQQQQAADNV